MNTLLFHANEMTTDNILELGHEHPDRRAEHVINVLKLRPGDTLRVGALGNGLGRGVILTSSKNGHGKVKIQVHQLNLFPPPKLPLHLIIALPRPKSLRRILRSVANIGAASIDFVQSYRVEKSYWSATWLEPIHMETALIEGLSIANDTILPKVRMFRRLKPYVEDEAAVLDVGVKHIAHPPKNGDELEPRGRANAKGKDKRESQALAIGPEGGWTDYEVELFEKSGFEKFSLGGRILSVENAIPTLVSSMFLN